MTKEELQKHVQRRPFIAFKVRLAGGEQIDVPSPDHAHLHPKGRTLFVHLNDGTTEIIDVTSVTALKIAETA